MVSQIVMLIVAVLLLIVPSREARAQVGVQVGPGGVAVETGRDRGYRDERYRGRPQCREIRTKQRLPDGSIRYTRERRCR